MGCKRNWEVGGGPSLCLLSAYTSVFFSLYCPFSLLLHHMRKCGCTLVNQVSSYIERQTGCLRIPIPNSWERVTASPLSITSQKKEGLIPAGHVKGELFTARHPRRVIFFFFFFLTSSILFGFEIWLCFKKAIFSIFTEMEQSTDFDMRCIFFWVFA